MPDWGGTRQANSFGYWYNLKFGNVWYFDDCETAGAYSAGPTYVVTFRYDQGVNRQVFINGTLESTTAYTAPRASLTTNNYVGGFAVTVGPVIEGYIEKFKKEGDDYKAMLLQFLSDRLAEGGTEYLHRKIRKEYWGYAADETLDIEELFKVHFRGIRPAVGYPSLPDQSVNFKLNEILDMSEVGIRMTENGAMSPSATVSGLLFAHPESRYFNIGRIGEDQLADYAALTGRTMEEVKHWLRF